MIETTDSLETVDTERNVCVRGHVPWCTLHQVPIKGIMNEQWDAYYCEPCNRWLEKGCDGSKENWDKGSLIESYGCPFDCLNRPEKPIAV